MKKISNVNKIEKNYKAFDSINVSHHDDLRTITTIQSFQLLKKLGEGAYSTVYKVKRKIDGEIYALKKVKMKNLSKKERKNSLN